MSILKSFTFSVSLLLCLSHSYADDFRLCKEVKGNEVVKTDVSGTRIIYDGMMAQELFFALEVEEVPLFSKGVEESFPTIPNIIMKKIGNMTCRQIRMPIIKGGQVVDLQDCVNYECVLKRQAIKNRIY